MSRRKDAFSPQRTQRSQRKKEGKKERRNEGMRDGRKRERDEGNAEVLVICILGAGFVF
jgi:hypothetical protein